MKLKYIVINICAWLVELSFTGGMAVLPLYVLHAKGVL